MSAGADSVQYRRTAEPLITIPPQARSYVSLAYRGYEIKPKRDFGRDFYLVDGMPAYTGFIITKDGALATPGAVWVQTVAAAKEFVDILIATSPEQFWNVYKQVQTAKAAVVAELLAKVLK